MYIKAQAVATYARKQTQRVPDGDGTSPMSDTRALRNTSSRDMSATAPDDGNTTTVSVHTHIIHHTIPPPHTHQVLCIPLIVDEQGTCFGAFNAQHVDDRLEGCFLCVCIQVHTSHTDTISSHPRHTCAALSCSLVSTSKCTVEERRPGITPSSTWWLMVDSAL